MRVAWYSVWVCGMLLYAVSQAKPLIIFHDYYPRCPGVCMYELAQAELQAAHQEGSRKFIYEPFEDDSPVIERNSPLKEWMKEAGLDKYEAYFIALAKSEKLTDEQKISERFCQIPPIADLYAQEQATREELLEQLWRKVGSEPKYPLRRIFEALLCRSGVQLEKKYAYTDTPLRHALIYDDIPLVVQLLKQGANANGPEYCTIELAKSVDTVRLLISYGADIKQQHKMHDLVFGTACHEDSMDLFSFFLDGEKTRINESNRYGEKWFTGLCSGAWFHSVYCSHNGVKTMIAKAALLLQYGCRYDAVHENMLMRVIKQSHRREYQINKQELVAMKEQLQKLFARDKAQRAERMSIMTPHNNVCKALQRRAITGNYQCKSYPAHKGT